MKVHKIREKCNHDNVVTVVGKSNTHYLVNNDASNTVYALPISQWEDVPQDRWQDVTGECEVKRVGDGVYLENDDACVAQIMELNNYRLRKVQVALIPKEATCDADQVTITGIRHNPAWAFIVEREVSE